MKSRRIMRPLLFATIVLALAAGAVWFGFWIPNRPSRAVYPIQGIDVSHHQRDIRWDQIDPRMVQFAYIKATEGGDFRDADFARNWQGARAAGVARGAYHFYTLGTPGAVQAANFIAVVPNDAPVLPPAIDLEISGYNRNHEQPVGEFQHELAAFVAIITAHYGNTPVIYTTSDFQRDYLRDVPVERLWIREVILRPGQDWTFWQFSPRGRVRGVSGLVDLNVFRGTAAEFQALLSK